ncbi:MAG TPA: hypothetical protein VIV60_33610 [Polyangiaceae bacterium]
MAQVPDWERVYGKGYTVIKGSFAPNGASALVAANTYGTGFTVARQGVGVFRLTLAEPKLFKLYSKSVDLQLNALADTDVMFGPFVAATATAAATLDILVKTAGVAADIAANANNRIDFEITVSTHESVV